MSTFKRGSDNLWDGVVLGTLFGLLVASADISFVQTIVSTVMNIIPSGWLSWAGNYAAMLVFGLAGAIIGYAVDYY